jgi:hypothetical protein
MCSSKDGSVRVNRVGHIGFALSLLGVVGVCLAGFPVVGLQGMWLAFLSVPGLVISLIGLFIPPRRLAVWGTVLGIVGVLYVPTIYLSLFVRNAG